MDFEPNPLGEARSSTAAQARFQRIHKVLREITERLYVQTSRIWLKSVPVIDIEDEISHFERQIHDVIEALKIGDHGAVGDICRAHISMSFMRMKRDSQAQADGEPLATKATA